MPAVEVERVASQHLYEDERVLWADEQPIPRKMPLRLLAAMPGVVVIAAVAMTMHGLAESDPMALTGARGYALPMTLAAIAAAGAGWVWGVVYRPIRAYRGVQRLHAVLTDRRFLWLEELADGTSRVRHPSRMPMLCPGDVETLAVREREDGSGEVALLGRSAPLGTVRVDTGGPSAGEAAALLGSVLRVPAGASAASSEPRGSGTRIEPVRGRGPARVPRTDLPGGSGPPT